MDLLFLWTRKFKNIIEQGFSFSDQYIYYYDALSILDIDILDTFQ